MSKEFEEIVLKKLEKLDNLEVQVGSLTSEMKETNNRLGKLETEVGNLNTTVGKLEIEVMETEEVVKYLNNNFTKFDYEINKKIDTLFDAYKTNEDKSSVHETEIASLNAKIFNQDIRISNLEDKVLAAV